MKKLLLWGAVLGAMLCGGAEFLVKPSSYTFTPETWKGVVRFADPNFTKLTDGETKERVCWDLKKYHYKPATIVFKFAQPVKLKKMQFTYLRGPKSYGIKAVKVYTTDANGKKLTLGGQVLNQPYEFKDVKKQWRNDYLNFELNDKIAVSQVTVEVSVTGSYVALQEVSFYSVK